MSRDVASARRMACAAAEDLWALEDAIREKADWWVTSAGAAERRVAESFRRLIEGDDELRCRLCGGGLVVRGACTDDHNGHYVVNIVAPLPTVEDSDG
jgi:hypothetical protein